MSVIQEIQPRTRSSIHESSRPSVRPEKRRQFAVVVWLSVLARALAAVATLAGLPWPGGAGAFTHETVRGQASEMYGRGLYEFDTLFTGAANKGTDVVTLALGILLLAISIQLYRRGSVRGDLLLLGTLPWFLYVGASYSLYATAPNSCSWSTWRSSRRVCSPSS